MKSVGGMKEFSSLTDGEWGSGSAPAAATLGREGPACTRGWQDQDGCGAGPLQLDEPSLGQALVLRQAAELRLTLTY